MIPQRMLCAVQYTVRMFLYGFYAAQLDAHGGIDGLGLW